MVVAQGFGRQNGCTIIPSTTHRACHAPGREPHREPILQNPSSTSDPAPPPAPLGGGDAAWAQLASDLKTVQQQALATQQTIDQLQVQQEAPAHASLWPTSIGLPMGGGALAAALVVAAAFLTWRLRRRPQPMAQPVASDSITSDFDDDPISLMELQQTVQEEEISQWATAPETEEDLVSDWGAIPLVRPDPATTFDLKAATSEVTRVRKTLAQRRHERALQREHDARLLRQAAQHAEEAAFAVKLQEVPHRGFWVPDLDLSQDLDAHFTKAAEPTPPIPVLEPFVEPTTESAPTQQPLPPSVPVDVQPMNTHALEVDVAQAPSPELLPAPLAPPDNTPVDVYAVKLALAQESEAVELWDEAQELAEEVLASPDPVLVAQAKALLAEIAQKRDAMAQDSIAFDDALYASKSGGR